MFKIIPIGTGFIGGETRGADLLWGPIPIPTVPFWSRASRPQTRLYPFFSISIPVATGRALPLIWRLCQSQKSRTQGNPTRTTPKRDKSLFRPFWHKPMPPAETLNLASRLSPSEEPSVQLLDPASDMLVICGVSLASVVQSAFSLGRIRCRHSNGSDRSRGMPS